MSRDSGLEGKGGTEYSRWWKQHEQQDHGDDDPAAAGDLCVCVWRMGQDASWQVLVEPWVGVLIPVCWLPFPLKNLDSS